MKISCAVTAFSKKTLLTAALLVLAAASASAQVLSSVYYFKTNDAVTQTSGLLLSSNTLYGTAFGTAYDPRGGGVSGSLFKLNTDGTGFTNLYTFSPALVRGVYTNNDGANSAAQLVLSGNRLYGTTEAGGINARGTIFAVNTDGTGFTNFHNFSAYTGSSNSDGAAPSAGLVLSGDTLYGATSGGGSFGSGTVFAIKTDGTGFTNLYNFSAFGISSATNSDGAGAKSSLILSNGILYGTAYSGGTAGNGVVFAIHTDGTGFTNLHSFSTLVRMTNSPYIFTNIDGANPQAGLVLLGNKLYGTTLMGGASSDTGPSTTAGGTVFAVNIDGTGFTNLHSFAYSTGISPYAGLVLSGSTLYGTAEFGGSLTAQKDGAVFAINTDGTGFAILHTFTPTTVNSLTGRYTNTDGSNPVGNLILSGSTLYGTTENGGTNSFGTVFALNLAVAPPTIQFTANPTNGIARLTVQFSSPAVDGGGNAILAWNWNFGDGSNSTSTAQNPTHTYTNAATFLPTLTCINNNGDPVIGSGPAIVASRPPPIHFTANPTNGLPPLAVQFNSPAADAGSNTLVSWNWNFGDGSNSVAQNPSHTYSNSGAFFPSLTCVNNNGDTLTSSGPAIVVISSLLLNGRFETGNFTNWTLSGYTNSTHVATGSTFAHSGKYGVELIAPASGGTMGFLSQTLPTVSGASYVISLWLDSPFNSTPNDFQVSWNGNVLLDETNLGSVGWTNFQLTVTATGTSSTLQLGYLTGSLYFGLDDVSIAANVTPTQLGTAGITLSGTNLVINGVNGLSNKTYYILSSTNLGQPLSQWTPVVTNQLNTNGNFTITATNAVDRNAPQRYYILESP